MKTKYIFKTNILIHQDDNKALLNNRSNMSDMMCVCFSYLQHIILDWAYEQGY